MNKNSIFGAVVCFIVAIALFVGAFFSYREEHSIRNNAEKTIAAVTNKGMETDEDEDSSSTSYYFDLTYYDLDTSEHKARRNIDKEIWDRYEVGKTVDIFYDRTEPSTFRYAHEMDESEWFVPGFLVGAGVLMVGFGGLALALARKRPD